MTVTQTLFAQALARETGLTYTASLAWSAAEVGAYNNLGIMSGGHPVRFPTPAAGAKAAAALIASSSLYAGIRASVGKSAQAQMDAIARSPWHLGPSGVKAAGGIDPYYVKVFKQFGYVPTGGGGGSSGGGGGGGGGSSGCTQITILVPNPVQIAAGLFPIPRHLIDTGCFECGPGYVPASVSVGPIQTLQGFTSPQDVPGHANACVKAGTAPGARPAGDVVGQIFTLSLEGLAPLLVNGAILAVIVLLAYSGLSDLLESG